MRKTDPVNSFTLLELVIVVIIVAILVSFGLPAFQGAVIKSKLAEMYPAVSALEKAEELYYAQESCYLARGGGACPDSNLLYTDNQSTLDYYSRVLGVDLPGLDTYFRYSVYHPVAGDIRIYVRTRGHNEDIVFCDIYLEGPYKGRWHVNRAHPWWQYVSAGDDAIYYN